MICKKCGQEMPAEAVYCMMCGKKLISTKKHPSNVATDKALCIKHQMENILQK